MKKSNPLLSICIPTYNRADIISRTIKHLLSLENFDDEVELVIADNASTDNTESIIKEIIRQFKDKRIIYHKNDTNIKDLNFYIALSLGTGKYLKLFNDYTYFDNDILLYMKKHINDVENDDINLFFYNQLRVENIKNGDFIYIDSLDKFQKIVNNKVTWISNFGCWKNNIKEIDRYNYNSASQLLQMEWTLYLVNHKKKTKIVNVSYNCFELDLGNRTPYNFFTPHVLNYYKILDEYKNIGRISMSTIRYDKNRILSDFVGNKIIEYLILDKSNDFSLNGSWKIVLKHFYCTPNFYKLLIVGVLKKIKKSLIKLIHYEK